MPPFGPIKRRDFIRALRELGFDGPFPGSNHQIISMGSEFSKRALTCSTFDLGIRITTVSSPHLPQPLFLPAPNLRPPRRHPSLELFIHLSRLKVPAILAAFIVLINVTIIK